MREFYYIGSGIVVGSISCLISKLGGYVSLSIGVIILIGGALTMVKSRTKKEHKR